MPIKEYTITARVAVTGTEPSVKFKPITMRGLYVPARSMATKATIEKECTEFIISELEKIESTLKFKVVSMKIQTNIFDFILNKKKKS